MTQIEPDDRGRGDETAQSGLPLEWMATSHEATWRSAQLAGEVPGPARILAAALLLADDEEIVAVTDWLDAVANRAEARADTRGRDLARRLAAAIDARHVTTHASPTDGQVHRAQRGAVEGATAVEPRQVEGLVSSEAAITSVQNYVRSGQVIAGIAAMQSALTGAYASHTDAAEAAILPFLAHAHIAAGDNLRAAFLLRRSAEIQGRLAPSEVHGATVLSGAVEVNLLAAQGDCSGARSVAAAAIERVAAGGWAEALIVAFSADALTGIGEFHLAEGGCAVSVAADRLVERGLFWAASAARRAQARSLLAEGLPAEARAALGGSSAFSPVAAVAPNQVDEFRAQIIEAGCIGVAGDRSSAAHLATVAAHALEKCGAVRWQIEALIAVGAFDDGEPGAAALASAHGLSIGAAGLGAAEDPWFDTLWASRPAVRVEVIGRKRILVGDREVTLGDKAEQLFIAVLVSGSSGAHWETVASWLWPDEIDMGKLKSRVSSTTNLARKALGAEAWRLERDGPLLRVHRHGLTLDLDGERDTFLRTGVAERATEPLLPAWADLEWVEDLADERRRLLEAHD